MPWPKRDRDLAQEGLLRELAQALQLEPLILEAQVQAAEVATLEVHHRAEAQAQDPVIVQDPVMITVRAAQEWRRLQEEELLLISATEITTHRSEADR